MVCFDKDTLDDDLLGHDFPGTSTNLNDASQQVELYLAFACQGSTHFLFSITQSDLISVTTCIFIFFCHFI